MTGAADAPAGSLRETGEWGLLTALHRRLPQGGAVLLGPGDDAAVVAVPDGRVVVTVDLLVEGVHFRRDWAPAEDIGARAAAASLADVAAMGARPTALVVGLAAPGALDTAWTLRLSDGMRDEAASVGASLVGGDVTSSSQLVLSVTALGDLEGRSPVTRAGARPGDVVAVAGRLGWAAAGLAVLQRGFGSPRALVAAYRRPEPPYGAGPAAAIAGATSMCDVSDGLLSDLGHIARASGVGIDVQRDRLPVAEPLQALAAAYQREVWPWVLSGGEDHALVATFPPDATLPDGFRVVGTVTGTIGDAVADELAGSDGTYAAQPGGVTVDGRPVQGSAGYEHYH